MNMVYIAIGSNLNDPIEQVKMAITRLQQLQRIEWQASSSLHRSKPMGPQDQPDFVNAVVAIKTALTPGELLSKLKALEHQQGREVTMQRWGPRVIDLDILLYGKITLVSKELVIPHPGLESRDFVLAPLAEIAPDLVLPSGKRVAEYPTQCEAISS